MMMMVMMIDHCVKILCSQSHRIERNPAILSNKGTGTLAFALKASWPRAGLLSGRCGRLLQACLACASVLLWRLLRDLQPCLEWPIAAVKPPGQIM